MRTKFVPARYEAILSAAKLGLPKVMLASAGGINIGTLDKWLGEGEAELEALYAEEGGDAQPLEGTKAHFFLSFQQSLFFADLQAVQRVREEFTKPDGAWQAAAWWLERRHPDAFGRKVQQQVVGPGGGPIQIQGVRLQPLSQFEIVPPDEVRKLVDSNAIIVHGDDDESG